MNLIKCFSTVEGHKNAIDLVTDLNAMKSSEESEFYIHYYKNQNYSENPFYKVVANVTQDDWEELNMEDDFMKGGFDLMIKRKDKFETPNFIFWLTEYEGGHYQYDMILSSKFVAPSATKEELGNLADFIKKFVENTE